MIIQNSSEKPQNTLTQEETTLPTKKRGRPKKSEVNKYKAGNRGKVGRPKGDAALMNEFKARLLASPKSAKVLEKIFEAALDDEHKAQQAAWKLIMDRMLPVAAFEKEIIKEGSRNAIQINITGVGTTEITSGTPKDNDDIIEGEIIE